MAFEGDALIELDLQHVWHPCSQMKDYETFLPLPVSSAQGAFLQLADGRRVLDAVSSWWCKPLGHSHPRLRQALITQVEQFEHVMLANITHSPIAELSAQLAQLMPPLDKVSYASDGSCAVEMALKMSVDAQRLSGQPQRSQFISLQHSYHGETALTLAVSDCGLYKDHYQALMPPMAGHIDVPYVSGVEDPRWVDCSAQWPAIEAQLNSQLGHLAGVIVEPLLQGAGGMLVYSADFLRRLRQWCTEYGVHLIADEIMTGYARTGKMFACQHADVVPDFLCIGKGLTAGWLPMSAMLTSSEIYQLFYDDYETGKAFMHSHTHSGNALAAAVALETLRVFEEEQWCTQVTQRSGQLMSAMQAVAEETGKLTNIRSLGWMVAADIKCTAEQAKQRLGYQVFQRAVELGALLRPLGNTLYWLPPLNLTDDELTQLQAITTHAIVSTLS